MLLNISNEDEVRKKKKINESRNINASKTEK